MQSKSFMLFQILYVTFVSFNLILCDNNKLIESNGVKRVTTATRRFSTIPKLFWLTTTTLKQIDLFCADKEDDGHYEHEDCRKYWHCLYVGTIFQSRVERKCPIGTMFHPFLGQCEISTALSCKLWRKKIFGPGYVDPSETTTTIEIPTTTTTTTVTTTTETTTMRTTTITTTTLKTTTTTETENTKKAAILNNNKQPNKSQLEKLKAKFLKVLLSNEKNFNLTLSPNDEQINILMEKLNVTNKLKPLNMENQSIDDNKITKNSTQLTLINQTNNDASNILTKVNNDMTTNLTLNALFNNLNKTPTKNFTLLTSNGKKTVMVPIDKTMTPDNLRNLFIYLSSKNLSNNATNSQHHSLHILLSNQTAIKHLNGVNEQTIDKNSKPVDLVEKINNGSLLKLSSSGSINEFSINSQSSSHENAKAENKNKNNDNNKPTIEHNYDDSLVFEHDDLSLMDIDFLIDNLKLDDNESVKNDKIGRNHNNNNNDDETDDTEEFKENSKLDKALRLKLTSSIATNTKSLFKKIFLLFTFISLSLFYTYY